QITTHVPYTTLFRSNEGVNQMVVIGFDDESIPLAIKIAEEYENIYAAVGWHPVDAIDYTEEKLAWLEKLSYHPKVVALGEMGLRSEEHTSELQSRFD